MTPTFNHMGITVSNLEKSLAFYCDTLGLPKPPEGHVFPVQGQWLSRLVGANEARLNVAFVPLGEGVLELLEYVSPNDGKSSASLENWDTGAAHLAINKTNLRDFYEENKDVLDFFAEPQVVEGGPWAGTLVAYLRDPDGISVELVESQPAG